MSININVVQKLTPEKSSIQGEHVLTEGRHYHVEREDDDTWTVVLHYKDDENE